jgi:hypothetical protein
MLNYAQKYMQEVIDRMANLKCPFNNKKGISLFKKEKKGKRGIKKIKKNKNGSLIRTLLSLPILFQIRRY